MTVMNNSVISWTSADELKTKELNPVRSEACLCHISCNRGILILVSFPDPFVIESEAENQFTLKSRVLERMTLLEIIIS